MKIAVIGATGRAGSRILTEAKNRRHDVTAIVRNAAKLADSDTKSLEKDIFSLQAADLEPFDAVVNAFGTDSSQNHLHLEAAKHLVSLLKGKEKPRLLIVGGAGSLLVDDQGTKVSSTPNFPPAYLPTATAMGEELVFLRTIDNVNWTFFSPAAEFGPGERTGQFRLGKDHLLTDAQGQSHISMEDYAIALVDEIEHPYHIRERFTIGY
ncbi:NAD(P)-dependent oxidoreductase [Pelosinus baikalensis]|uniref:NAD(P)-dependent oxidoreductase n=1 Tax=Pelosinus baikalensis TaxID=2892015 RepID=A0ABS8HPP4_9FIRM|nr:NAD(P)-dependent oxidoreductase [Pelosinus baikalensis]MCC5464606.1 NAD(P)-dependent oxidoreductase [Pelosinus baikalensis]